VSKQAWADWLKHQTMLVNENRLNLADARARQYLARQMENHFFGAAPMPQPALCRPQRAVIAACPTQCGGHCVKTRPSASGPGAFFCPRPQAASPHQRPCSLCAAQKRLESPLSAGERGSCTAGLRRRRKLP
jgi:hypothetical protein